MNIQIDFWQLVTFGVGLLLSFFSAAFAAGKLLGAQWQKSLDQRFATQDKARTEGATLLRETLDQHMDDEKINRAQLLALEREFLLWRSDLPHKHGERLSRLEVAIKSVPTNGDLAKIYDSISQQAEKLNRLCGEFEGYGDMLRLILNQVVEKGMK